MKLDEKKGSGSGEYQIPEIGFFEGTEKLLEVWFHHNENQRSCNSVEKHANHKVKDDLREIPR